MNITLAVVIPFFQRRQGILEKAVLSALEQIDVPGVEIVIVDDCSPVPATDEVKNLISQHPDRIRIIRMEKNSGPAAARNKGLDNVRAETEYVAFLDSDDEWSNDHLKNALYALDNGFDLYFSDFYQLHQQVSAFDRAKRIRPSDHKLLHGQKHLHIFGGDMFAQVIKGNVVGTSTVVYRYRKFPKLRFQEDFRSAGEDYLFWLDLSTLIDKIAFSSRRECRYGEGVNIFSGATWGNEGAILKIHDQMKYLRRIEQQYRLTNELKEHICNQISRLRSELVGETLHRLVRRKSPEPKLLASAAKLDPGLLLSVLPITIKIVLDSFKSKKPSPQPSNR